MGPGCRVSWFNNEAFILIYRSADDKKGYTPPPKENKGETDFRRRRGFRCICGRWHHSSDPEQDVCASTVHSSSHIHRDCLRTAERPTACVTSVQALSPPKSQTSWYPVRTRNISAHRQRVFHPRRASSYGVHIGQRNNTIAVVPKMLQVMLCA